MGVDHVTVIGTSHIAPESVKKVVETIRSQKPDIVAVELDKRRLMALTQKQKRGPSVRDVRRVGIKGWAFASLGSWIERALGKRVGVSPGEEMLQAIGAAAEVKARVALIDQDIEVTLRRFSKALTWKEKGRFVVDLVKGLFGKNLVKFDLSKVPPQKMIDQLIKEVKVRYPSVYKVLIEERNHVMAKHLARLVRDFPDARIVAVVGAGHQRDLRKLLKKYLN